MKQLNQSQISQIIRTALQNAYAPLSANGVVETDVFYDEDIKSNVIEILCDNGGLGFITLSDDEFSLDMTSEKVTQIIVDSHNNSYSA